MPIYVINFIPKRNTIDIEKTLSVILIIAEIEVSNGNCFTIGGKKYAIPELWTEWD